MDLDLETMREAIEETLVDSCVVLKPGARVTDTRGGGTTPYTPLSGGPLACRVAPGGLTSGERLVAGRPVALSDWTVTFKAGAPVDTRDRLEVTMAETAAVQRFEVTEVGGPRSNELALKVGATKGFRP